MNQVAKCEDRLKNVIVSDKRENPIRIERVLKAELYNVIRNYFEVSNDDIDLSIIIREDGRYDLQLNAKSRVIKIANCFDN